MTMDQPRSHNDGRRSPSEGPRTTRPGPRPSAPIAEYHYRHEAEFAAGFLRGAGIPFRLQIDDAGGADAGVTMGRPAVLWVRGEDEEEARAILDLDGAPAEVKRRLATDERTDAIPWAGILWTFLVSVALLLALLALSGQTLGPIGAILGG